MTDVNLSQFPTEELVAIFSRVVDESKGDVSAMFEKLNISVDLEDAQSDKLKEHLKVIASGNKQEIQTFIHELKTASEGAKEAVLMNSGTGGVTKFVVHWWGVQLYISHQVLQDATDIGTLVAAVSAICGPKGAALAAAMGIALAVLKLIDGGNGIILSKAWVGPVVPTRQ